MVLSAGELHIVEQHRVGRVDVEMCEERPGVHDAVGARRALRHAERVLFVGIARPHRDLPVHGVERELHRRPGSPPPPSAPASGGRSGRLGPSVTPIAFPPRLPFGDPSNVTKLSSIHTFIPPVNECTIRATFVQE